MEEFIVKKPQIILTYLNSLQNNFDWEQDINSGRIRVGKYFVGSKYLLKVGDIITHDPNHQWLEPKVNEKISIIYEDYSLVVIDKPAPLPVHPCGSYFNNTLVKILQHQGRNWFTINRLDSETSGLILFAKHAQQVKYFSKALMNAEKIYLVLVEGNTAKRFNVEIKLGRKEGSLVHKRMGYQQDGKESFTKFKKIFYRHGKSLLFAYPKTGRTHQIRAHLSEEGYAVFGDKIYGNNEKYFIEFIENGWNNYLKEKLEINRHFLHCYKTKFYNPILEKQMIFKTPLPIDLKTYLDKII